jgi:hypothetical protein
MPRTTEPPAIIRISDNTILAGKFYSRYEPLPVERVEDLPLILQPLVVSGPEPEGEEPDDSQPRNAMFEMNTLYQVDPDGRLGRQLQRRVQRQVAELEAAAQEADWIEEEISAAELPASIAAELEDSHRADVERQKAQAAVDARRSDEASDAAATSLKPPQFFVRRGSRHYTPIGSARLKPGEPVFIRKPEGRFEFIGETDSKGSPPDVPITV